jgi:hypothetical protein
MNQRIRLGLVLVAGMFCMPSFAADKYPLMPDLTLQNVETFQVQADLVRREMQKGGRYEYIRDDDRVIVEDGLNYMHDLIDKNGTVAAMKEDDKIHLFNRQEVVNTLLTHSDGTRIICEKTDQPGSLFRATKCDTYATRERRRRSAEDILQQTQGRTMVRGFGAAGGN